MLNDQEQQNPTDSLTYECELCGEIEWIPLEVIQHFDLIDPGLPGQPATFQCQLCPGIMYPHGFLRAKRVEPKAS